MKRLTLFFTLIIVSLSLAAQVAVAPSIGDGTAVSPYEIASLGNLYWIAASNDLVPLPDQGTRWSSHYMQTMNIDATDTVNWFDGLGWNPIGYYYDDNDKEPFTGSYNGQGYSIDGFFINRPDEKYVGLFKYTEGVTFENIGLTNVNITGGSSVGALVGSNNENSLINNCSSTGNISGNLVTGRIGGLAGENNYSIIDYCYTIADIYGFQSVGGLVGLDYFSAIENSYSTGTITGEVGSWGVGGIAGDQIGSTINNCYSTGTMSGTNGVGGIVGMRFFSSIENSYTIGNIGSNIGGGGLVGIDIASTILNSHSTATVYGHYYGGGLVGFLTYQPSGSIFDGTGYLSERIKETIVVSFSKNDDLFTIENSYSTGDVGGYFYVGGLVGFLTDRAAVKDCYSTGSVNGSGHYIGGLVGTNQNLSTIGTSYSTGDVSSTSEAWSWTGGLVGENWNARIINCYSSGNVIGMEYTGGLVGENNAGTIKHCYSIGTVTSNSDFVGGLVGFGTGEDLENYWNIETSGQAESSMGEGRHTSEMTYPYAVNTYINWDFDETWSADIDHDINNGYPYLMNVTVSIEDDFVTIRKPISLTNYPNPFNPETIIRFHLPEGGYVKLNVFNIKGQSIFTLLNEYKEAGWHQILWNGIDESGRKMASGVYLYQLSTKDQIITRKMIMVK